jgi:hypothetical protein
VHSCYDSFFFVQLLPFPAPVLCTMADTPPQKKKQRPDEERPDERRRFVQAVENSDFARVRAIIAANEPVCNTLINPESYGNFHLLCSGGAAPGAGGAASGAGGAAPGAGGAASGAGGAAPGAGGAAPGVAVYDSLPFCLLHLAVQIACRESDTKGPAHNIVRVLLARGANVWGCKDVQAAAKEVVESYTNGLFGYEFGLDPDDSNEEALSVLAGVLPVDRPETYRHVTAGCLPLHEALRSGSPALVEKLCTAEMLNHIRLVGDYFDKTSAREGQYLSLLAFVTRYRESREDGAGLAVLQLLVQRLGVSPLDLECPDAGCAVTECPVLHGLVHHASCQQQPLSAAYVAESEKMLDFLVSVWPQLLGSYDRECLTPSVLAARDGETWFVLAAAKAAKKAAAAATKAAGGGGGIGQVLDPQARSDSQEDEAEGIEYTNSGLAVPHGPLNPTKVLPAAAHAGEFPTVLAVVAALGKNVTSSACEYKGIPVPVLAVRAASTEPEHLAQLRQVLDVWHERNLPLCDGSGSSPLHIAALCEELPVVECVVAFAKALCPSMLTQATDEHFTPLMVAVARVAAAAKELTKAQQRAPVSVSDVQECTEAHEAACAIASFLFDATKH